MINLKTPEEIKIMREGGKILAEIIKQLSQAAKPGITTKDLDKLASDLIKSAGARPAFLGYGGFPATLCVSVNDEVVHGVPSERVLKEGDIVSLDLGLTYKGFITDSAITVPVLGEEKYEDWAKKNPKEARLIKVAKQALNVGIKNSKPGTRLSKLGRLIQETIESHNFGVVKDLVGHGVGKKLHEDPSVPNFEFDDGGIKLEPGMVIAIEPMITMGDWRVVKARDGFTYNTKDGSLAAHFEHTLAITDSGAQVLTE